MYLYHCRILARAFLSVIECDEMITKLCILYQQQKNIAANVTSTASKKKKYKIKSKIMNLK